MAGLFRFKTGLIGGVMKLLILQPTDFDSFTEILSGRHFEIASF
jgi:hypothetical protein